MYLFKEGRKHYLDFLRNVTPQALLVFVGAVFMHGGLQGQPTLNKVSIGVLLWIMAVFAAWCSVSLFFESLKEEYFKPGQERARTTYPDIGGSRATCLKQSVKRLWHMRRLIVEFFLVMLIIEATCFVAAISGGFSMVSALHLNQQHATIGAGRLQ